MTGLKVSLFCGLIAALAVVGAACRSIRPGGDSAPAVVSGPAQDELNPVVSAPAPHVVVPPDLPALTPPEGSLPQAQIIAAGIEALNRGTQIRGGQLTLAHIALAGDRWELVFRGDGRSFTFSGGPRPADPRKGAYSHVIPVDKLTYQIESATGKVYGTGITGGSLPRTAALEHYRGFLVSGGEQTTLRLVTAGETLEGRDLTVWVSGQALKASGLALWQLHYGTGRLVDVWGLTVAPGEVLAHRLAIGKPPGEELLDHELMHGIPLPDGVRPTKGIYRDGAGYTLEGYTVNGLKAWYLEQMERYGWTLGQPVPQPGDDPQVLRFVAPGWQYARVAIRPDDRGVQFELTWGMTRAGNPDQALAAVFRELGDDPAFRQFPRTPGSSRGEINIGGPAPGTTIPATFESRARMLPNGDWEVVLSRSWGPELAAGQQPATTWTFRVEQDLAVRSLGQLGDQPPAIP